MGPLLGPLFGQGGGVDGPAVALIATLDRLDWDLSRILDLPLPASSAGSDHNPVCLDNQPPIQSAPDNGNVQKLKN